MMLIQCPHCKNRMKCQPSKKPISDARKRCVYCGKSFKVKDSIVRLLKS